jgi:hypothetical protein
MPRQLRILRFNSAESIVADDDEDHAGRIERVLGGGNRGIALLLAKVRARCNCPLTLGFPSIVTSCNSIRVPTLLQKLRAQYSFSRVLAIG